MTSKQSKKRQLIQTIEPANYVDADDREDKETEEREHTEVEILSCTKYGENFYFLLTNPGYEEKGQASVSLVDYFPMNKGFLCFCSVCDKAGIDARVCTHRPICQEYLNHIIADVLELSRLSK